MPQSALCGRTCGDILAESGELLKGRGTQFDPAFVDVFLPLFESGELEEIAKRAG